VQQLIWLAQGHTVRDVVVDGEIVVRGGRCTTVDEDELHELAATHQRRVLARAGLDIPQRWPVVDGSRAARGGSR
jgi:5-methylthioadenosine/S-adenosylhomocysteine deaminase